MTKFYIPHIFNYTASNNKNNLIIYKAEFSNGKKYIGLTTKGIEHRIKIHFDNSKRKVHKEPFYNAIRKYNFNNIKWSILCECYDIHDLNKAEQFFIHYYKTTDKKFGYNLTSGGGGIFNYKHSEETKQKISKANKGEKNYFYGKHHSEETKQKIAESNKRRVGTLSIINNICNLYKQGVTRSKILDIINNQELSFQIINRILKENKIYQRHSKFYLSNEEKDFILNNYKGNKAKLMREFNLNFNKNITIKIVRRILLTK